MKSVLIIALLVVLVIGLTAVECDLTTITGQGEFKLFDYNILTKLTIFLIR